MTVQSNLILESNEIHTSPGLSPISMFPKMLEGNGDDFSRFLETVIFSRE
ncbi:hypothetical protein [Microbulbifer sp. 2205BS26-8]